MEEQKKMIKELITTAEVATLMRLSVRSIYRKTKQGLLKRYTFDDNKYFYKRSEIVALLKPVQNQKAA